MDVAEFSHRLCEMNTVIAKYLSAKEARDCIASSHNHYLSNEVEITIQCVLGEKIDQYEKHIIELATKLSDRPEEQPVKKKK